MPDSMTMADAALRVFPNVFLFDGGRYLVATLVMTVVVALMLRSPWRVRRLQARTATMADRRREWATSLRSVVIYALVSTPALWLTANGHTVGFYRGTPGVLEAIAYVVVLLVAHDTWFYWTHRAMHDRRLFKRFHRTHHKSITPTPFAAYAFDWPEAIVQVLFVSLWVAFVPTPWIAMFSFLGIMIARNVMGHAGVEVHPRGMADHWVWGWFNTTTHHDLHHNGSFNHNYGLYFTWWDRMMGTEHPRYREIFREVTARPALAPAGSGEPHGARDQPA